MRTRRIVALAAVGGALVGGAATAWVARSPAAPRPVAVTAGPTATGSAAEPIAVTATDTACTVTKTTIAAGPAVFAVTNQGGKETSFAVYAAGNQVLGETGGIAAGARGELRVTLPDGRYEAACRPAGHGTGIRSLLAVTAAAVDSRDPLELAADTYQRFVWSQTGALLGSTQDFAAAVKRGDVAEAKRLFTVARAYWERLEPVAALFGDLDPRIDGREEVVEEGFAFTGFHRIEKDLWVTGDVSRSGPMADRLVADVTELVRLSNAERMSATAMADGAKELLDEIATGKITGEEDRYSHTDLWDFKANLEGSQAAITALRPVLQKRDPALLKQLDAEFANVEAALDKHRAGTGWKLHTQLSQDELKELTNVVNALAEPVSKVAAVVTG